MELFLKQKIMHKNLKHNMHNMSKYIIKCNETSKKYSKNASAFYCIATGRG